MTRDCAAVSERFFSEKQEQIAREADRLPSFVIIGAMKCGTTSMRHILIQDESIFLPQRDVCFFDLDDIEQHGDYFIPTSNGWTFHDFEGDFETYYEWYKSIFAKARDGQIIGENSTTYISSKRAPERISRLMPQVKLVAMLRDPVSRAYSHYWHNLFAGRVTHSFEETLYRKPGTYLSRGYYREQLERYRAFFGLDRLKVIIFEEFIRDQQAVIDDLTQFLGMSSTVDLSRVDTHRNPSVVPLSLPGRRLANRAFGSIIDRHTTKQLPNMPGFRMDTPKKRGETARYPRIAKMLDVYRSLRSGKKLPPMKAETRHFLERLFRRENAGLSDLIERDVSEFWPYMNR